MVRVEKNIREASSFCEAEKAALVRLEEERVGWKKRFGMEASVEERW